MFSSAMMYLLRVHLFSPGVERMRLLKVKVYKSQLENMIFTSPDPRFSLLPDSSKIKAFVADGFRKPY